MLEGVHLLPPAGEEKTKSLQDLETTNSFAASVVAHQMNLTPTSPLILVLVGAAVWFEFFLPLDEEHPHEMLKVADRVFHSGSNHTLKHPVFVHTILTQTLLQPVL